jgi:GT2 family glycosyltransferase
MLAPNHARTTLVARSPALDAGAVDTVITLPTFKRPDHLLRTLESLRAQRTRLRFAIVVMDNDAEGLEGAEAARPLFQSDTVNGLLIIAHERGNCSAYNAGWDTALLTFPNARRIAVIDDDELADPDWLQNLTDAADRFEADIVGGPQVPVFESGSDQENARHPVFQPPYSHTGTVPALYSSGNLLVGRAVLDAMGYPFLDTRFNFLGGGDSDFISRAAQRGFRLAWCNEAVIRETVPARRLEWDWIRARSLRNGVISTLVEKRKRRGEPLGQLRTFAKSLALALAAPPRAIGATLTSGSAKIGSYPLYVAAGRVLAEFGYANEQYRNAEKN